MSFSPKVSRRRTKASPSVALRTPSVPRVSRPPQTMPSVRAMSSPRCSRDRPRRPRPRRRRRRSTWIASTPTSSRLSPRPTVRPTSSRPSCRSRPPKPPAPSRAIRAQALPLPPAPRAAAVRQERGRGVARTRRHSGQALGQGDAEDAVDIGRCRRRARVRRGGLARARRHHGQARRRRHQGGSGVESGARSAQGGRRPRRAAISCSRFSRQRENTIAFGAQAGERRRRGPGGAGGVAASRPRCRNGGGGDECGARRREPLG
jgi:hypothetical protein